jgi:putative aldouronate transport system substrate-binding protein
MKVMNTNMIEKYVKQGVLAPFTDEMLKKVPNLTGSIDKFGGKDQTVDAMYDGKLYVLKTVNLNGAYDTATVWRTDWLKNVGINKIPETLAEWEDALYKFRNNDPDKNGKKDTYGISNTMIGTIFGAYGQIPLGIYTNKGNQSIKWTIKNGNYVFAVTQPEMKDALTLLQKWYKDGIIDPEFITGENTGGYWAESQAFENGKVGVTGGAMSYHWNPPYFQGAKGGANYEAFLKVNPDAKFGTTFDLGKPMVGPNGKSGSPIWGAIGNSGLAFTTKCVKDPNKVDAVLNMMNTLSSDYDKFVFATYGIKDKHYTIDQASGQIAATKDFSAPEIGSKNGLNVTSALYPNPDFVKKTNPLQYKFMDKYNFAGYADLPVPATDASTKYLNDLKTLALNAYIQIITGEKPISYFDEFVKTFNDKGGAEIEKQTNDAIKKLMGK